MRSVLAVIFALGCTAPRRPVAQREIAVAIETGDLPLALHAICSAYARIDLPCANTLAVELLTINDVMSRMDHERQVVRMQPMPEDGFYYWDNWSQILSAGQLQMRSLFASEPAARRVAKALLVSVLAHEIGHHVAQRHACNAPGARGELRADELAVPIIRELMPADLQRELRLVTDQMIWSVPPELRLEVPDGPGARSFIAKHALPERTASYASLHLSRQRAVFGERESPAAAAARTCLPVWRRWLSERKLVGGLAVRTVATLPKAWPVAIDRAGQVWGLFDADHAFVLRRLDAPAAERRIAVDGEPGFVAMFAFDREDRFAFSDGSVLWTVDATGAKRSPFEGEIGALAYDERHVLHVATRDNEGWIVRAEDGTERARIVADRYTWADGEQVGDPREIAVDHDRVMFYDVHRAAVRVLTANGAATLAGSRPGRRDGPAALAELFDVQAIQVLADGRVMVAERAGNATVVRTIGP